MTDNHMVFFAEIAFIYGGNDSSERNNLGSEKKFLDKPSGKAERGDNHKKFGTCIREQAKNILKFDLSVIFARRWQKSNLKHG